jgi:MFS family permease
MAVWADNHGRRTTIIVAVLSILLGSIILIFAQGMWMAVIGLLMCGIGTDAALALFSSISAECFDDNLRQKIGSVVQSTYILGTLVMTLFYYLFEDWKITTIYCLAIPAFINVIIIIIFVKESPMYLIIASP